jgi:fermentation-respiration switch protein FrsA (DUF1100 family)
MSIKPTRLFALTTLAFTGFLTDGALAQAANPRIPPPECQAHAGFDRDLTLPGYLLPTRLGPATCIPFTATAARPPAGYRGDFYVDEFSDVKLRERWAACKTDKACFERVDKFVSGRRPPNKEHAARSERNTYLLGKVDSDNAKLDLKTIRRPAFFAREPWREAIGGAEAHTYTVEFSVPPEPYERTTLKMKDDVKVRGWYQVGPGVDDGKGGRQRALIIMTAGGGGRIVAIEDEKNFLYYYDPASGKNLLHDYPNETTGASGQRGWRDLAYAFNRAGFDVLNYDRRGVGVSGGFSDTNTVQQGRDILKVIGDLKTGNGVRVLTPAGEERKGLEAAKLLTGGNGELPVILFGSSRGTMSNGFAMARNFDKACDYDLPVISCAPAVGLKNIKGAMNVADYTPGMGYLTAPTDERDALRPLYTAGTQDAYQIVFFPSSAILASVSKWPALFIGRGLWDYAASLEGAIDAIDRVKGLKELMVVRASHPIEIWPAEEMERATVRMIAFARAAALGHDSVPGARLWTNMKELAATASDVWEPSSQPGAPGSTK